MNPGFGRGGKTARGHEREKMLLIASAGLAVSLLVLIVLVLNFRTDASASRVAAPESLTSDNLNFGTINLLAPKRLVRAGTPLREAELVEVPWPRSSVPDGAVLDQSEVIELYAATDLEPSVPLKRSSLSKDMIRSESLPVTPGMRAVSIEVDATSGIEGHARPGTRVDVVLTYEEEDRLTSKVVVQNARVLSYAGEADQGNNRGSRSPMERNSAPVVGRTITLEVSPASALGIQTARQMGRLSLLMRAREDDKPLSIDEVPSNSIDGRPGKNSGKAKECSRGKMRMAGKDYIIDCDGRISEVMNQLDP